MRLAWMREDLGSARRAATWLVGLLAASMGVNLLLAVSALRLAGHERVVLVPPTIHKSFWVEAERVSPEYLEQMGYFLLQLTLNVTPQSVDQQAKLLLQYAAPASYGELRTALAAAAERIKRDSAATVFSAQDISVDAERLRVGRARPAHHLHQRPARLRIRQGLRPGVRDPRRAHLSQGLPGDPAQ